MDPILIFFAVAGASTLIKLLDQSRKGASPARQEIPPASRLQIWRGAAAACGLNVVRSTNRWTGSPKLEAQADPFEVRFEAHNADSRIVVNFPGPPGLDQVWIRRRTGETIVRGTETGDEDFDQAFFIHGPMPLVCGLLDAETRRLLLRVNAKCHLAIAGGEIQAEMFDVQVPFILPLLLELGRRFVQERDFVQCLLENARRDPAAGVRINQMLLLVREHARDPRTAAVLHAACSDASPRVRLWTAQTLGDEGRDVLRELAESTEDDDISAQALGIVGRELPFERTTAILEQALQGSRLQTACACLEVLGGSGTAEAVNVLAKVVVQEVSEVATVAAQALGMSASPAAETPLIQALYREWPDLRIAAAQALGRVGSARAVLPLQEAASVAQRFPRDRDLFSTTRQAIAEIQSRLPGALPGQLSLAETEAGQLSIATDPDGQLSLAPEDSGQLSLSDEKEKREPAPEGE
ncbi:MAG TPA: HEAT repeat domain-containing protein [Thermoanaerobaculia bacterium]